MWTFVIATCACIPVQLIQVVGAMVSLRLDQKPKTQRAANIRGIWKCSQTTTIQFYVRLALSQELQCQHCMLECYSVHVAGIVIRMDCHGSSICTPVAVKFGTAFQMNKAQISVQHSHRWSQLTARIKLFGCHVILQWCRRTCSPNAVFHCAEPNRNPVNSLSSFHVHTPPTFAPATPYRKVCTLHQCHG